MNIITAAPAKLNIYPIVITGSESRYRHPDAQSIGEKPTGGSGTPRRIKTAATKEEQSVDTKSSWKINWLGLRYSKLKCSPRSGFQMTTGIINLPERPKTECNGSRYSGGKAGAEADCDLPGSAMAGSVQEEISPEIKARIEEEAYNKGYQEGLKKTQVLHQFKEEEEEKPNDCSPEYEDEEEEGLIKLKSSKIEECIDYLHVLYPKLLNHWNVFSIVAAGVILLAVLLSMYNSLTSCAELPDGPSSKATCSATQKYSWFTSGLQQKQRRQ